LFDGFKQRKATGRPKIDTVKARSSAENTVLNRAGRTAVVLHDDGANPHTIENSKGLGS
jgi:hypothetical protein